jgi:hypothetical protein
MTIKLFQIYDRTAAAGAGPILTERREAPAIRMFHELLGNKEITPGKYPDQFDLVCLGSQDEDTLVITPLNPPETVATGAEWIQVQINRGAQGAASLRPEAPLTINPR